MSRILLAAALAALTAPAFADDVSISIGVSQPGFYGQINIGDAPRPPVIYAQPVVIQQAPEFAEAPPIYLHVPPGHEKHWSKHCGEYHACGRRVYFVQHDWYKNDYAPRHRSGDDDRGRERHEGRGHGQGRDHDDRDQHDRDH
jgi:hypothetical protein